MCVSLSQRGMYMYFCFRQVIFVLSTINYSELTYRRPLEVYTYPGWALVIGWMLAVVSILWIPITSVYKIFQYRWKGKVSGVADCTFTKTSFKMCQTFIDRNFLFAVE